MSQIEIVVSGHSSDEESKINLPKNVEVMFYAESGKTCYLPDDVNSLNGVIQAMKSGDGNLVRGGKQVNNYDIEFYGEDYEGVFDMDGDEVDDKIMSDDIDLEDLVDALTERYPGKKIKLYAIFCRGSAREDFASGDFGEGLGWNTNEDDFGFTGGKKKKRKTRKKKRKKKRKKRKTKRTKRKTRKTKRRVKKRKRTKRR